MLDQLFSDPTEKQFSLKPFNVAAMNGVDISSPGMCKLLSQSLATHTMMANQPDQSNQPMYLSQNAPYDNDGVWPNLVAIRCVW